ncbi:MAG: sulfite exporter TauE/SafE family protein [Bacillota bacterium]|nr:sulfite exporter TauE/SafE family protein [Bacillota bacterium]
MSVSIVFIGLIVGFLVGLTGVGGAALLTPILLLIGVNPTIAVGSDFVYNSITKMFGVIQHWRQKTINFKMVKYFSLGSLPSALLAFAILRHFDSIKRDEFIKYGLGYILILVSISIIVRIVLDQRFRLKDKPFKTIEEKKGLTICMGAIFGFIVGLTSIGSGSLFALAMLYLYRMSATEIVGTDIAHAFLLVTLTGLLNISFGNVNYPLVFNLLVGSIPGVLIGSNLSAKVPAKPLKAAMALVVLVSGLKLL